jgi:hypothetical protein
MDVKIMVAMVADEIMLITLMVAHEDILTMHTTIILPPTLCFLYGLAFWMVITLKRNIVLPKIREHDFLSWIF